MQSQSQSTACGKINERHRQRSRWEVFLLLSAVGLEKQVNERRRHGGVGGRGPTTTRLAGGTEGGLGAANERMDSSKVLLLARCFEGLGNKGRRPATATGSCGKEGRRPAQERNVSPPELMAAETHENQSKFSMRKMPASHNWARLATWYS